MASNPLTRPAAGGQFVPQIRGISQQQQQQRNGNGIPANRLSPQQLLQAQTRVASQQLQGQVSPQAQPITQSPAQVQNSIPSNGVVQTNTPHLSPPYTGRDSTASPVHLPHHAMNIQPSSSPRPPSAQAHPLQPQIQNNPASRVGYYMPNLPGYTAEQIQSAIRLQQSQVGTFLRLCHATIIKFVCYTPANAKLHQLSTHK